MRRVTIERINDLEFLNSLTHDPCDLCTKKSIRGGYVEDAHSDLWVYVFALCEPCEYSEHTNELLRKKRDFLAKEFLH